MRKFGVRILLLMNVLLAATLVAPKAYADDDTGRGVCKNEVGTLNRYCCQDCTAPFDCHTDDQCKPKAE